ncbi:MAG: DUF4276 family protein [Bryobacteraceae bacterium]|jgi:hypothetical protein
MPSEIRIYFEGDKSLKAGFDTFLRDIKDRAKAAPCKVSIVATGGTPERDFGIAMRKHPAAWNILLRDSEGPFKPSLSVSLCEKAGWPPPRADSIFWMVEMMESWFHADKDCLEEYYGSGFRKKALTANPRVEEIPKQDLIDGLKDATRDTKKGAYHKTKHAPFLLEKIRPALVRTAAPNCERLFQVVLGALG